MLVHSEYGKRMHLSPRLPESTRFVHTVVIASKKPFVILEQSRYTVIALFYEDTMEPFVVVGAHFAVNSLEERLEERMKDLYKIGDSLRRMAWHPEEFT